MSDKMSTKILAEKFQEKLKREKQHIPTDMSSAENDNA